MYNVKKFTDGTKTVVTPEASGIKGQTFNPLSLCDEISTMQTAQSVSPRRSLCKCPRISFGQVFDATICAKSFYRTSALISMNGAA